MCTPLLDICVYVVKRNLSSFKLSFSLRGEVLRIFRAGWDLKEVLIVKKVICNQIVK